MKSAACIVIALHLLALVAVSQTMLTLAESEQNSGLSDVDVRDDNGCKCSGHVCECCVKIPFGKACAKLDYAGEDDEIGLLFTLDGAQLISLKFPVTNPPKLCKKIKKGQVCLKFYDVSKTEEHLKGCLKVQYKPKLVTIEKKIGCFEFPIKPKKIQG